jgi:hypothetical protein
MCIDPTSFGSTNDIMSNEGLYEDEIPQSFERMGIGIGVLLKESIDRIDTIAIAQI